MSGRRVPRAYAGAARSAPSGVEGGQYVAEVVGDEAVVFLIGMRVNRWRRLRSWWPVFGAMPRMLAELQQADLGILGARTYWSGRVFLVVQYWRSAAELGAYARDPQRQHAPAWGAFNKHAAARGDIGIFHETFVVPAEAVESLYGNMPVFGLAAAHRPVPRASYARSTRANAAMQTTVPSYVSEASTR